MIFNFSFNDSLDFTKFKKHSNHYISLFQDRKIEYHLSVNEYKLVCKLYPIIPFDIKDRLLKINFIEIKKDEQGDIVSGTDIIPLSNLKFKDIKEMSSLFCPDNYIGTYTAKSTNEIVDFMCRMVKFLHKINRLSAFL